MKHDTKTEVSWRTIDSVPKDGSAVLLCLAIDADGKLIDWNKDPSTAGVFVQVASWSEVENRWRVYINTPSDAYLHFTPTHWKPVPAPPSRV